MSNKMEVYQEARIFCHKKNLRLNVINATVIPSGFARLGSTELTFSCVKEQDFADRFENLEKENSLKITCSVVSLFDAMQSTKGIDSQAAQEDIYNIRMAVLANYKDLEALDCKSLPPDALTVTIDQILSRLTEKEKVQCKDKENCKIQYSFKQLLQDIK